MSKLATARTNMIQCQLKPNQILEISLLNSLSHVDREDFILTPQKNLAYADCAVQMAGDRNMLPPLTTFQLIHFAAIKSTDRVMVIGSLTGYSVAVISRLAASVIGVEENLEFAEASKEILRTKGISRTKIIHDELCNGYTALAPYDVIIIEGGAITIPQIIIDQLSGESGRMVAIMRKNNKSHSTLGQGVLMTKIGGNMTHQSVFDAAAKILPGFDSTPAFQL